MSDSFLFYDLETFGSDPRRTRIAQFAALRTDAELNPVEDPISLFVQPADDLLPSPVATLITGITPQRARREGRTEADAIARIAEEMARPRTCTLGYNSLRFDDEFIRYGLFRNFRDPYEREWRGGNSRWDLLDVLRLTHALRPEGIVWPKREDGYTSFRLEHLAIANDVREGDAHEALSDVLATLGMARKLRQSQPRLWDYALRLRDKRHVASLLDAFAMRPILHVSQRYPASRMCAAAVLPLAQHPSIGNRCIVFDLDGDVEALASMSADEISDRLYTPAADLPAGERRVPLKEVHMNRSPMLIPWAHLRAADFERLAIDPDEVERKAARLRGIAPAIAEKTRQVFSSPHAYAAVDVDASLYDGFLDDHDRRLTTRVRSTAPSELDAGRFDFHDERLPELLFRYHARNWPETLDAIQRERWNRYRQRRLDEDSGLSELTFAQYFAEIAALRAGHPDAGPEHMLLDQLEIWGRQLQDSL
ncbi:MAG: exodeoxyribonuclease I [Xanthomonadaceae bacterium]|jgi:exodeoxyribonuclease-1|nr:exodeoxyribonuclease I [Xanthomonadaceae bacterium]